jgi:hypothetical protein
MLPHADAVATFLLRQELRHGLPSPFRALVSHRRLSLRLCLDALALAWEYLRRHPDYRLDWLRRIAGRTRHSAAHRWGLRLLEDPALDARDAHPAWLPGHDAVVQLYPMPTRRPMLLPSSSGASLATSNCSTTASGWR